MWGRLAAQCQFLFPSPDSLHDWVGRSPWTAADALVGLLSSCVMLISLFRIRVQEDSHSLRGGWHSGMQESTL
jgi:hypothetical protein